MCQTYSNKEFANERAAKGGTLINDTMFSTYRVAYVSGRALNKPQTACGITLLTEIMVQFI